MVVLYSAAYADKLKSKTKYFNKNKNSEMFIDVDINRIIYGTFCDKTENSY